MKVISENESKQIQLKILDYVDKFCKENDIKYFLCAGSLIGAVRHKGFIPWDDDIDLMMLRDDYEKFNQLFHQKSCDRYAIRSRRFESDFVYPFSKIEDTHTVLVENVESHQQMGIAVDLMPIDDLPDDPSLQKKVFDTHNFWRNVRNLKVVTVKDGRSFYKNLTLRLTHFLLHFISLQFIASKIEKNAMKYRGVKGKYCGVLAWATYGARECNLRSNYDDVIMAPFEDRQYPIPVGYDDYLTRVYRNYMQLPPKEKQVTHHAYKAIYWKEGYEE